MLKNLIIVGLAGLVIVAMGFAWRERSKLKQMQLMESEVSPTPTGRPRIPLLSKGDKLADSPISKFAFKIAPGNLSDDARSALTGWIIKSVLNKDGSVSVSLTPNESDDQSQTYIIKTGESLYFVEMTPVDDKNNTDSNLRDDYGIIVNAEGIVQ